MTESRSVREAYRNAAALVRSHHNRDHQAEATVAAQLDAGELADVVTALTGVADWLLNAYSRTSGISADAALDVLVAELG